MRINLIKFQILFLVLSFMLIESNFVNAQMGVAKILQADEFGLSADSLAKMDQYFHGLVDDQKLAGIQTAVISQGNLVHFDSYGYSNIEEGKYLDDQSIFRIFSMTKPIVSVALMQLYEEGKFKLEDPLYKYIPSFKESLIFTDSLLRPATQAIRIVDLLRHTSGLSYGYGPNTELNKYYTDQNLNTSKDNKEFVEKLSRIPLSFEPGTNWQYGLSTNICGYLVELFSGLPLNEYLEINILDPLGMVDTHFQLPESKASRFTIGYGWRDDELYISEGMENNRYLNEVTLFNGGGGLISTTYDYLKFCQMLLNKGNIDSKQILKEATINLMFSDHLMEPREHQGRLRLPLGEASFGLGFAIRGENENNLEQVYGWGGAVGTYFKINLEHDLAYVLMIQLSPYRHLGLRSSIQDFINASILEK